MAEFKIDQCFEAYLSNGPTDVQIKTINELLSKPKTVAAGWSLLNSILNYCPLNFFDDNVLNWLDNCLLQHSQGTMTEIKLSVVKTFLEASIHNHELSKKIVSDYLSKIVDFCLSSKSNCQEIHSAFDVLTLCMRRYGSWFAIRKTQIEKYILCFLENDSEFTVNKAAVGFLHLQQVGNAGIDSVNHRNNFRIAVQRLCSTVHDLLDTLLEDLVEINKIDRPNQEGIVFEQLPPHAHRAVSSTAKRIKNVVIFLMVMLQENFTTYKEISPIEILNVIVRGTEPKYCTHSTSEKVNFELCLALNTVQIQLLYLLKMLILWLRNSSLPYSFTINKILIDSLKKSQKCKCYSFNCVYHEAIYKGLKTWITISKCGLNSHFQIELIECIRKDITPVKTSVTLKIQTDQSKKQNQIPNKEHMENKMNTLEHEKEELKCLLALDTLTTLFSYGFIRVDKNIIQDLHTLVINILNKIDTAKCPHLYTSVKNQQQLYELVVSFYNQETSNILPFLPVSLNTLNNSLCHKNPNIAKTCKTGLDTLERLCQPVSIPFSMFTSTPSVPFSNENEQIIDNNVVMMECVTDIADHSVEINVLENRTLNGDVNKAEIQTNSSDENIQDMSISLSCSIRSQSDNVNSSESVASDNIIFQSDQLEKTSTNSKFTELEDDPSVKKMKMTIEQLVEAKKPGENTSSSGSSNMFEEFNSFIDEVEEDS